MTQYHFTVNGVPGCAAEETMDPRFDPPTVCQQPNRKAVELDIKRVRILYSDAEVKLVEGRCPQPNASRGNEDEEK